jgi:hypothetical protein
MQKTNGKTGTEKSDCEKFRRWNKHLMRRSRHLLPMARRREASALTIV